MSWRLPFGLMAGRGGGSDPLFWVDSAYDSRLAMSAPNATGFTLHDHVLTATIPSGVSVEANSLRVVETTILGGIDAPNAWRYADLTNVNRLPYLPASLSGQTLTFKVLGQWANGVTRTFSAYWNAAGGIAALTNAHLGGNVQGWTYTVGGTLTVGDVYKLVLGGASPATYSYTAVGGDTTTSIAQALKALVNAGAVAVATGAAASLTIKQSDYTNATFSVASTGSTLATGTITITKPAYYGLGRVGPDTDGFIATYAAAGLPFSISGTALIRPGWGHSTSHTIRAGEWSKNSGGGKVMNDATLSSVVNNGQSIAAVGAMTGNSAEWTATHTTTYSHKVVAGRKSDDSGAHTLNKYVDVWRVQIVYTCAVAYVPTAAAAGLTTSSGHNFLTVANLDNQFGGNTTIAAGNKYLGGDSSSNWYASTADGTITAYDANADLSALSTSGGHILGATGNTNTTALLVNSIAFANFGSQSPAAYWYSNGNAYAFLGMRNLVNTQNIPQGATVTVDAWLLTSATLNATTTGDVLLPDEAVALLRGLAAASPTVTVAAAKESYAGGTAVASAKSASTAMVAGCQWFADNALAYTGKAVNTAYQKDLVTGLYANTTGANGTPDDDDGSYGEAHKLHGLCLRYLRLREASVLTQIERQVNFHIGIEAAAVAAYGSWWNGTAPYLYWVSTTPSAPSADYGVSSGDSDPAAVASGLITYNQGDVTRRLSIDQMHMVAHGLYAYLYLLRNESEVTANTALRTNALNLLSRMATFETTHFTTANQVCPNLYRIAQGLTPTRNNGITTAYVNTDGPVAMATPYNGDYWGTWEVSNSTVSATDPSANSTIDSFFRGLWSPDSTVAGVKKFLAGRVLDMTMLDYGHHEVDPTDATWNGSTATLTVGSYPKGWGGRGSATGNNNKYNAGRSGDKHYVEIGSGGVRDQLNGRHGQRLIVMCLLALLDPTATVTIENDGSGNAVRTANIVTLCDQTAQTLANHIPEPTSQAARWSTSRWLGGSNPKLVDSAFTGYNLMAMELYLLVKSGASYATYYPIAGF